MSKTNLNFEFDVRIPDALVQQMLDGEITCAMLTTMTILYKWANWNTGLVRRVCASSLWYASQKAFSERTFSEALRKLEWMRWITRKLTPGSTNWYPVMIHNYKIYDDAGKVQIINRTKVMVYEKFPEGRCDEASWEGSDEASWESSDEGSDRHESEHLSEIESSPLSENESGQQQPTPVVDVVTAPQPQKETPSEEAKKEKTEPETVAGFSMKSIRDHVAKFPKEHLGLGERHGGRPQASGVRAAHHGSRAAEEDSETRQPRRHQP